MPELVDGLDSKSSALGHVGSSPTAPTPLMTTYQRLPLRLIRGKGCWVWDQKGKKFLDAVAGIATCTLGHSDKILRRKLTSQLNKLQHVSNLYQIPEQESLAIWLTEHSCADHIFFCNSGAEANEAAIKLARKYGHIELKVDNPIILSAKSSFHGRTLAAISATGQTNFHKGFEPMVQGFEFFSYNDINSFERLIKNLKGDFSRVSAVLIEPIQGEGGVIPGDRRFFQYLRKICTENNILLIFDEVQTGMGRCGTFWGYEYLDVEPDAFTLAKGLGGGHPIGALLVKKHANIFSPGDHASTFGGNPFACKAALTISQEIEKRDLLINVQNRGLQLKQGLETLVQLFPRHLKEVRGLGLLQGLVLQDEISITPKQITLSAIEQKLLVIPAGQKVVRIIPPLVINEKEVNQILKRLSRALKNLLV